MVLVVFKLIWPQASSIECIAFIANKSNNARVFLAKDVSKALKKLGYTMKVTCTVAYQAFTERNLNCCHLYLLVFPRKVLTYRSLRTLA